MRKILNKADIVATYMCHVDYRIVVNGDKYQVLRFGVPLCSCAEIERLKIWSEQWCPMDFRGLVWWKRKDYPSPPKLKLFISYYKADKWIDDKIGWIIEGMKPM